MRTFLLLRRIQRSQICQFAISTSLSSLSDSAHPGNGMRKHSKRRSKEKAAVVKPSGKRATKSKEMPNRAQEEVPLSKMCFEDVFKKRIVYECTLCESRPWFGSTPEALAHLREVHHCEREMDSKRKCYMCGKERRKLHAHFRTCAKWPNIYINGGMTAEVWHFMTQYTANPGLAPHSENLESGANCVYAILHPDAAQTQMTAEKRIVYYGITDNISRRMGTHCHDESPDLIRIDGSSKTVRYIVLAENLSRSAAEELERILVYSYKPGLLKNTNFPKVEVPFTIKCRIRAAAYIAATLSGRIPVNKYPTREPKIEPQDAESHAWRAMLEAACRRRLLTEDALLSSLSVSLRPRSIVLRPELVHPLMAQPDGLKSLVASDPMVDDAIVPVLSSEAEKEHFRWRRFTPRQWAMVAAFAVAFTLTVAVVVFLLV